MPLNRVLSLVIYGVPSSSSSVGFFCFVFGTSLLESKSSQVYKISRMNKQTSWSQLSRQHARGHASCLICHPCNIRDTSAVALSCSLLWHRRNLCGISKGSFWSILNVCKCAIVFLYVFTIHSVQAECDTGRMWHKVIFLLCIIGFNSEFSFS